MKDKFYDSSKSIIELIDKANIVGGAELARSEKYLEWILRQLSLYQDETLPLQIPDMCMPSQITQFAYNKCGTAQATIEKYYDLSSNNYHRNTTPFVSQDMECLLHNLVLIRGNVVWVEFGFNVGCEFGGKHPAIILKNLGQALIVAPLTSGTPSCPQKTGEVVIDNVYRLPKRDRYTNITRISPVSIYRIDLHSPIGSIHSKKIKEIMSAMKNEWGL